MPAPHNILGPNCLYIGNYYEGTNRLGSSTDKFFNANQRYWQGTDNMDGSSYSAYVGYDSLDPETYAFTHPLNAECHELKIYDRSIDDSEVTHNQSNGVSTTTPNLLFYVPPLFMCDGPIKRSKVAIGYNQSVYQTGGGIAMSLFGDRKVISHMNTVHPYNIWKSLECEGLEMNLDNFVRDFKQDRFPRLQHLTSSRISFYGSSITDDSFPGNYPWTANEITYAVQKSTVKRNLTVLPCDNGKFVPNFDILDKEVFKSSTSSLFFNRDNYKDLKFIDLSKPIFTGSDAPNFQTIPSVGFNKVISNNSKNNWYNYSFAQSIDIWTPAPEQPSGSQSIIERFDLAEDPPYNIRPMNLQRLCETSSNEMTMFDVSDIFYGTRIFEGSLTLTDSAITGSNNKIGITLKDNKYGGLYRADAATPHAKWNTMGSVLYNEGILATTFPALSLFGKEQYKISFEGVNSIYITKYNVPANSNTINSSSNSSYKVLESPEAYASGSQYFMITNINFHDEDFNIVARANLAQPVFKRPEDKLLFKPKMDF